MKNKLTRLELTWPGKENRFNPEPRILLEDKEKSYSKEASPDSKVKPTFDNMLIHGDNLLALKALEQDYTGKVKCIYIDPPYNTGNAFEHYDDGMEHSIWLSLMRDRLEILRNLLSDDGVILVQIDKNESAYLKILMDEIFGRNAYVTTIAVRMSATSGFKIEHADKTIVKNSEYIHIYSQKLILKPAYEIAEYDNHYSYILKKETDDLYLMTPLCDNEIVRSEFLKYGLKPNSKLLPKLFSISEVFKNFVYLNKDLIGRTHTAPADALKNPELNDKLPSDKHVCVFYTKSGEKYFIKKTSDSFNQYIPISLKYQKVDSYAGYTEELSNILGDWWDGFYYDMGNVENEGGVYFKASKKPERLIFRILNMFTKPGDLVLDSFLGSGTTCAVAHKMGRRWIGIEMGNHCYTHCIPRLKKVINGEDKGGITKNVDWLFGGGFKFYELASSLIVKDKYGQQIISDKYNADMLAEAMCKILGYHYKPDSEKYWKQGYSSEKSFIYTTTNNIQEASLASLSEEIADDNLLICCSAFIGNTKAYPNIIIKKIPSAILKKCEWGAGYPLPVREDFSDEDFEFEEECEE